MPELGPDQQQGGGGRDHAVGADASHDGQHRLLACHVRPAVECTLGEGELGRVWGTFRYILSEHQHTICTLLVHYLYTICTLSEHQHTICTLLVHYLYTICTLSVHYLHTICILFAHYLYTICTLSVHYLHTICILFAHYLYTICTLSAYYTLTLRAVICLAMQCSVEMHSSDTVQPRSRRNSRWQRRISRKVCVCRSGEVPPVIAGRYCGGEGRGGEGRGEQ